MTAPVRTRFTKAVGHALLDEIELVSAMRERWRRQGEAMGCLAAFGPALLLMTTAIDDGKRALAADDGIASIAALASLRGFDAEEW